MLVFAGSRCYKSQVTAAGPHPREPHVVMLTRVHEGRRSGGEEEIIEEGDSQAEHGEAGWRQEVDREARDGQAEHGKEGRQQEVHDQAGDGQAQHGKEGRRGTLDEEEGGSQAGGGTGCPARCPEALDHLYRWAPRGPAGRTATEPALLRRGWERARPGQRGRVRRRGGGGGGQKTGAGPRKSPARRGAARGERARTSP